MVNDDVLVLYHSQSGHTRDAAEAIGDAARKLQHDVRVKSVIKVSKSDVQYAGRNMGAWHDFVRRQTGGREILSSGAPSTDRQTSWLF